MATAKCPLGNGPKNEQEKAPPTGKPQMGGQSVSGDFGGGGEGQRTIECALQSQFWRGQ